VEKEVLEPVWTKVLSKDDWATILLSMTRRGLAGLVVIARRARLLLSPIVACRRHFPLWRDGGWCIEWGWVARGRV